jgi:hypothetical protein
VDLILAEATVQNVWGITSAVIVLVAVVGGMGIAAGGMWYSLRIKQWEMSLKHAMLERGMSAEEIKTVLETSVNDRNCHEWWAKTCSSGKDA